MKLFLLESILLLKKKADRCEFRLRHDATLFDELDAIETFPVVADGEVPAVREEETPAGCCDEVCWRESEDILVNLE
jgi:hypothetical protein